MSTKKLNFSEMKNALSRSEMKNIMAGSSGGNTPCTMIQCSADSDCTNCTDNTHCKLPTGGTTKYCNP